jgi:hypothetical protein
MTIKALTELLEETPPGAINTKEVSDHITSLLRKCWQEFEGSDETSMEPWKVARAEDLQWNPPILSLTIERHGARVLGSTRGELHTWRLNLETRTAQFDRGRYRQLEPPSPKLDLKPIVADVLEVVKQGSAASSNLVRTGIIVWRRENEVWVYHGKLIYGGYQQTVSGRRKRFRDALTNMMKPLGWKLVDVRQAMIFKREA